MRDAAVYPARTLLELCPHLSGTEPLQRWAQPTEACETAYPEMSQVKGQALAKRALEVGATGAHSLIMFGPPGTGKPTLAERLDGILSPMNDEVALESAAIQSLGSSGSDVRRWRHRTFRGPRHTASDVALVGGGSLPRPGEISMAMHDVLFMDEWPEFTGRRWARAGLARCGGDPVPKDR